MKTSEPGPRRPMPLEDRDIPKSRKNSWAFPVAEVSVMIVPTRGMNRVERNFIMKKSKLTRAERRKFGAVSASPRHGNAKFHNRGDRVIKSGARVGNGSSSSSK